MERKPIKMLIQSDIGADILRTEIVKQAVKDYIHGHTTTDKRNMILAKEWAEDAEEFLMSEWAEWLVDLDCKWILKKVREKIEKKK